ncbi:MAG: PQQ-binding-like beta-propeller repeat protein, partial [Gammaproteobacteria bacterium]
EVPGESMWPSQPLPVKPPPLVRQRALARSELSTVTPESQKFCAELFDTLKSAPMFSPLGLWQTLLFPGTLGGANWSGASFDPSLGYLFVNVNEMGMVGAMKEQPPDAPVRYRRSSPQGEYARFEDQNRWPCQQPPWGTLNAVDLNRGEIVWRVPLGIVEQLAARGAGNTGTLSLGGTIVTAGGLVFIGGTNDARFRAFDARNGRLLWEARLDAGGHATPVTFLGKKSGKQFVVIAAGGSGYFSTDVSDAVVAFSLK